MNTGNWLKSKTAWTVQTVKNEVKIKMVQKQWIQLKLKFLLGYDMKIVI